MHISDELKKSTKTDMLNNNVNVNDLQRGAVVTPISTYDRVQKALKEKGLSLEEWGWIISAHQGNEENARMDLFTKSVSELKAMIGADKVRDSDVKDRWKIDDNSIINYNEPELTWNTISNDDQLEEQYYVESDFNPFDGVTWIVGAGGNVVPFAGVSTDVTIFFDSNDMVAIVEGGAGTFGVPSTGAGFKFGVSTADDYRDALGDYYSIGGSVGEGGSIGGELAGGVSDGRLRNLTFTIESGVGISALPAEGHFSIGSTESEPIWVGTKEEFWEKVDEEYKDFIEYTMDNFDKPPAWDFNYYNSLP